MTDESRRADLANDSGAYVLNALDKNEREDFEALMAESPELRNEVTELTDTSVLLGLAVEPVTPSADLKANIMSMLGSTPQLPKEVAPVRTLHAVPSVQDAPEQPIAHPEELNGKARARWFNRPAIALVSAAAAVALVLGGGGVIAASIANNNNAQIQQQASALAAINSAPDVQRSVATVSTGGKATLVWSETLGKSALITKGLTALPSDKTYELWYIDAKGNPTSAGLFDGTSSNWKMLNGTMSAGDTVGVTVEPSGGSDAPTTKPIVAITTA